MYEAFATGMVFPRPEDEQRLARYRQAGFLFKGQHYNSDQAKRLGDKLRELTPTRTAASGEGMVYLIYNLVRLICSKFADLQVLQTPLILMDDDAAEEALRDGIALDIPDHWARWHYALMLKRGYGDVIVTPLRDSDSRLGLRVIEADRWFPVLDVNDPLTVTAHQIAWTEEHEIGKRAVKFLRVDYCEADRIEHKAFEIEGGEQPGTNARLKRQLDIAEMATVWPGIVEFELADLGGLAPCVHLANGSLEPSMIFGRPEFLDSASLVDDINWRLASWSDVNDKISNPPRIMPSQYLDQDEHGTVTAPSQYTQVYAQKSRSGEAGEIPKYMTIENYEHATLKEQFEASVLALLIRHEMSPALLGLQFGLQKESGEAKSLGMGTTEAATRRDLLQTQPKVDRALTVLARLQGDPAATVSTFWRVGLPKSQAELMADLQLKQQLGLVTKKQMLEELYPFFTEDQIQAQLDELGAEQDEQFKRESAAFASQE